MNFKYKVKTLLVPYSETDLNAIGAKGWELVSVETSDQCITYYFKKQIKQN